MTVVATLKQQRRNVLEYLTAACAAALRGGEGSFVAAHPLTDFKKPLDGFPPMWDNIVTQVATYRHRKAKAGMKRETFNSKPRGVTA
jgi:hypothetical protein